MRGPVPRPIVKWAGGKAQLLQELEDNLPASFGTYYEPFFGGGALFFHLSAKGVVRRAILSDLNRDLMNLYTVVRDNVGDLITELASGKYKNERDVYYKIRGEEPTDPIKRAARFIYLNKTCYNGLYRVNAAGKFNVPFGRYRNPKILDAENLRAASQALQRARLLISDFEDAVRSAKAGDLVYFDPPYDPVSDTADFTSYTERGFGTEEQKRLARVFRELDERGCFVLESNSSTEFITRLYSDYHIVQVFAKRAISSDASTRGPIQELIIRNYEITTPQTRIDEF